MKNTKKLNAQEYTNLTFAVILLGCSLYILYLVKNAPFQPLTLFGMLLLLPVYPLIKTLPTPDEQLRRKYFGEEDAYEIGEPQKAKLLTEEQLIIKSLTAQLQTLSAQIPNREIFIYAITVSFQIGNLILIQMDTNNSGNKEIKAKTIEHLSQTLLNFEPLRNAFLNDDQINIYSTVNSVALSLAEIFKNENWMDSFGDHKGYARTVLERGMNTEEFFNFKTQQ